MTGRRTRCSVRGAARPPQPENDPMLSSLLPPSNLGADEAGTGPSNEGTSIKFPDNDIYIPRDAFSILYVTNTWLGRLPPVFVYFTQIAILSLIISNLNDSEESELKIRANAPVNVTSAVRIASYIACVVSVLTAGDFVDGVFFAWRRIQPEGGMPCQDNKRPPHSLKWELTNLMRLSEGMLVIIASFTFIVQCSTVIDIFLNFAGVTFVSQLDDCYYLLAEAGFFGERARQLAYRVAQVKVEKQLREKISRKAARCVILSALIIGLIWGLAVISLEQEKLVFACKSIQVIAREPMFRQEFRSYTGTYVLNPEKTIGGRAVYVQQQGKGAFIAYCEKAHRWKINPYAELDDGSRDWEECDNFHIESKSTKQFDVSQLDGWKYWTGETLDGEVSCDECGREGAGEKEECSWYGRCIPVTMKGGTGLQMNTCDCTNDNRRLFGRNCEFQGPCTELQFVGEEFTGYGKSFHLLYHEDEPLIVHERPAYIQRNFTSSGVFALLLYDGGRWIVLLSDRLVSWDHGKTIEEYLATEFNAFTEYKKLHHEYISDLTAEYAPWNVPFQAWLSYQRLGNEQFSLACADCESKYGAQCDNKDLCQKEKSDLHGSVYRCQCETGFIGPQCQIRPAEGTLSLFLEHGQANSCITCGEKDEFAVRDLYPHGNGTCIPYPREPLVFEANGTLIWRQIGLYMNETHFSVFASDNQQFYPKGENTGARESICVAKDGSKEVYSIERGKTPTHLATIDIAIFLKDDEKSFGEVVDPEEIDCLTMVVIDSNQCDGSMKFGTLSENYGYNASIGNSTLKPFARKGPGVAKRSDLSRAWIKFQLKITI